MYKKPKADPAKIEKLVRDHIEVAMDKFVGYLEGKG
jgi:hypothetical protein